MQSSFWKAATLVWALFAHLAVAQQYYGNVIPNSLPSVPGSELNYFRIHDPNGKFGKAYNITLTNYQSLQANGKRLVPSQLQRAVIIIHGLNRDPGTYISNIMSALSQVTGDPNVNFSSVALMAPYFPNGLDKNYGYPYNATNPNTGAALVGSSQSYSGALVWQGSAWSGGGANQYPAAYQTISSYAVLDQLIQWFGNKATFPNMKEIVIAGHSLGGQMVQRYAAIGNTATQLGVTVPVSYWIANPNSYVWLNSSRPLSTASCPDYDQWRDGLQNVTGYIAPATYNTAVITSVPAIQANYYSKNKAYARGLLDTGDDSSGCEPEVSGSNRNERFFAFINSFPPTCESPNGTTATSHCDTVDFMNIGHDAGSMMASPAGRARLFTDNFYGNGSRAYDFGYPRVQKGDDPYPDPSLAGNLTTDNTVYAGNMTAQGCYVDSTANQPALSYLAYDGPSNTIQSCTTACVNAGYTIAGVEQGSQCYCGNALGGSSNLVVSSACTTPCTGNATQICGNNGRINLYSNGPFTQLAAPGQPDSVDSANYNYLNCYSEATSGRALSAKSYTDTKNMTLDNCAAFCSGYKYFGVEYAQECYCGGCFNIGSTILDPGKCNMLCTGDQTEYCGAGNALSVYQIDQASTLTPINQTCGAAATTTTAATPTSTIPAASLCPATNGQNITDANNNTYVVTCSSDSSQGSYASASAANSYLDCMGACDTASNTGCTGFVYVGAINGAGSGTCYLKTVMGTYSSAGSNLVAAALVGSGSGSGSATASSTSASATATSSAVSCPAADGTTFNSTSGAQFLIECGIDHSGGDMSSLSVSDFASCINACGSTAGCVDVSLSGSACYLKGSLGGSVANANIMGAKLITLAGSSISSAASSTTVQASMASANSSISITSAPSSSSTSSTTTVSTSTTTSIFPSATSTVCPGMDQMSITDSNGAIYNVYCSADSSTTVLSVFTTSTGILGCMVGCDTTTGCTAFTYAGDASMSGGYCYLRTIGARSSAGSTLAVAYQVAPPGSAQVTSSSTTSSQSQTTSSTSSQSQSSSSAASSQSTVTSTSSSTSSAAVASQTALSCPASNATIYTASSGALFQIECYVDHQAGDMGSTTVNTFEQCIEYCAATTGCIDLSLSGVGCYIKSTLGAAVSNNGVLGAKLIPASSNVTSSTSSVATNGNFAQSTGTLTSSSVTSSSFSSSSASTTQDPSSTASSSQITSSSSVSSLSSSSSSSSSATLSLAPSTTSSSITSTSSPVVTPSTSLSTSTTSSSSSSTISIKPTAPAIVNSIFSFQGCYNDTVSARALQSTQLYGTTSNPMSLEMCGTYCAAYTYWGVEYGQECYCANSLSNNSVNGTATSCKMACPGNSTELCGAGNRIQLYSKLASSTTSAAAQGTGSFRRRGIKGFRGT